MSEKIYVCLYENGGLSLETRFDVDAVITNAEEFQGNMPFTVLGSVKVPVILTAYLIIAKVGTTIVYNVIEAKNEEAALSIFKSLKRNINRTVSIKRVEDLTHLIKEYYS
jgi:precorrin-6B methylase 2